MNNSNNNISLYCSDNKYGYKYNINHPKINELYLRYKEWKGIAPNIPMSDNERFEFEKYIDEIIEKKLKNSRE